MASQGRTARQPDIVSRRTRGPGDSRWGCRWLSSGWAWSRALVVRPHTQCSARRHAEPSSGCLSLAAL